MKVYFLEKCMGIRKFQDDIVGVSLIKRRTQLKLTWIRLKSILGDLKFDSEMLEVEFILILPLPLLPDKFDISATD